MTKLKIQVLGNVSPKLITLFLGKHDHIATIGFV
jgi:hypothetical protein